MPIVFIILFYLYPELLFVLIQIVDIITRETLGPNQSGELCIKGDHVMLGYMNQHEATTETFDEDGWLLTGNELATHINMIRKFHIHRIYW